MLKALIVGNVGGDPDMRYTANGQPLLRFSMASNGRRKDRDGEWVDKTTWVRVTIVGPRAESLSQYIHKGTKLFVEGNLEANPWVSERDDTLNAGLEVFAHEIQLMAREDNSNSGGGGGNAGYGNQQRQGGNGYGNQGGSQQRSGGQQAQQQTRAPQQQQQGFQDMDPDGLEDLPF